MIFSVINKETGCEVYRYSADTPIEWTGMEFTTHNHIEYIPQVTPQDPIQSRKVWTPLEFLRRFTQTERIAIREAAKVSNLLDDYLRILDATPEVWSDDPDVISSLNLLEQNGLILPGRAQEILNG